MTIDDLVAILKRYPGGTEVEFASTDGPDYGWLEIGPEAGDYYELRGGHRSASRGPIAQIDNSTK